MKNKLLIPITILSLALYICSLTQPAFFFERIAPMLGLEVLELGAFGILMLDPRWYANVVYIICLICGLRGHFCLNLSVFGFLLVLGCFIFPIYHFPTEAAGVRVIRLGIGAYLWGGALALVFALNFVGGWKELCFDSKQKMHED